VTRGQFPQRAGSLGLSGGGTATAVPTVCIGDFITYFNYITYMSSMVPLTEPD